MSIFLEKFNKICAEVKKVENPEEARQRQEAQTARHDEELRKKNEVTGELWSIHKRRLVGGKCPTKCMDVVVAMNLPRQEAEQWVNRTKAKLIDEDNHTVEYYERVLQEPKKKGPLYNDYPGKTVLKEEGSDAGKEIEIIPSGRYDDVSWQG